MANSPQARKRAIQAEASRKHNASQRSMMRTFVKRTVKALDAGNKEEATAAYAQAVPLVDKMVNKGIIHKNKAARQKSRLNARLKAL